LPVKELTPPQQTQSDKTKRFNQGVLISFLAHAIVLAVAVVQVTFFSKPLIDISQAVRVDMVSLPDQLKPNEMPQKIQNILKENPVEEKPDPLPAKEEPQKIEKVALPKKEVKPEPDLISLKKAKAKQKSALDKLKALSAIDKMKQEMKAEAARKPVVIKGRVISAGSTLTGLDKLQADNYLQNLDSHIKQYWALPQWLMNKSYKTRVLVKFDSSGKIISKEIVQPSGQPAYDDYCLLAIDQASPFPKFTEKFSEKYSRDGVVVGFPE